VSFLSLRISDLNVVLSKNTSKTGQKPQILWFKTSLFPNEKNFSSLFTAYCPKTYLSCWIEAGIRTGDVLVMIDQAAGVWKWDTWGYPLVNIRKTMERSTIFHGKIHYKW
jgi:hypothetical protein